MVEVDKEQEGNNGDSRLSVLGSGCRALADSGKFWLEVELELKEEGPVEPEPK